MFLPGTRYRCKSYLPLINFNNAGVFQLLEYVLPGTRYRCKSYLPLHVLLPNGSFYLSKLSRRGGIGRRAGLKIPFLYWSVGSTPTAGIFLMWKCCFSNVSTFCFFPLFLFLTDFNFSIF